MHLHVHTEMLTWELTDQSPTKYEHIFLKKSVKQSVKFLTDLKSRLHNRRHPIKGTKNVPAFRIAQW